MKRGSAGLETVSAGVALAAVAAVALWGLAQQPSSTPQAPQDVTPPLGEDRRVATDDIDDLLKDENVILVDVREADELEEFGTIEGAVHIPLGELEARMDELPKDRTILTA